MKGKKNICAIHLIDVLEGGQRGRLFAFRDNG